MGEEGLSNNSQKPGKYNGKAMGEGLLTRNPEGLAGGGGGWALGRDRFLCHVGSWDNDGSRGRGCS